jgi:cytochrome c553
LTPFVLTISDSSGYGCLRPILGMWARDGKRQRPNHAANDPAAGLYIIATAGCRSCHGEDFAGGGGPPPGAANITPVGIGDWSEQDFLHALREHKRPNGSTISEAMPRAYGRMTDDDLNRIYAYLKTVPRKGEKTKSQVASATFATP